MPYHTYTSVTSHFGVTARLYYIGLIHSDKRLPVFVENRVKTIKSGPFTAMKYCPTSDNAADLLSRGLSYSEFSKATLWIRGPLWLPEGEWPICNLFDSAVLSCQTEVKEYHTHCNETMLNFQDISVNTIFQDDYSVINPGKLLRVSCYNLRFIHLLRKNPKSLNQQHS